jgi:UDP-glucose 4-epimerase
VRSLVTGGAGFIGSHLSDRLVERGDEVVVVDDLSTGKMENLEFAIKGGAGFERLDIVDAERLAGVIDEFKPGSVFHLAAQIDVRKSMVDPAFDARLNVVGTVNALEASSRAGTERFVFASTGGAIYGEGAERPDELPFDEDARCEPFSVYGQSKLAAEGYVGLYSRARNIAATTVRLGNVYGPRQDPRLEAGVVAIFCGLARDGGRPTVYGDGAQTRDYIHVHDVVNGLLAAETASEPGPFNIGTGTETSVLELAERIGRLAARDDFEPEFAPARDGEVERTVLDVSRAADRLAWRAERDLDTGIGETLGVQGVG